MIENSSLKADPQKVMDKVCDFLGLQKLPISTVASNTGRLNHLTSESDRKSFARIYPLASAASFPARVVLDNTGKYGRTLKSKLVRFGPTMLAEKLSSKLTQSGEEEGDPDLIKAIPEAISNKLDEDYKSTVDYCRNRSILLVLE